MNWTSIRVLTNNLEELLAQYARGEHREAGGEEEKHELKDEWWVGMKSVIGSLTRELNLSKRDFGIANPFTFLLLARSTDLDNEHIRKITALAKVARKLLADIDAARPAEQTANEAPRAASP